MKDFLKKFTNKWTVLIMSVMVIVFIIIIVFDLNQTAKEENLAVNRAQAVQIIEIGPENNSDIIKATGTVMPEASIEVIALTSGTLRNINFKVGQSVTQNQILANLQNNSLATNYTNAQVGLANTKSTNQSMILMAEENVRQAENGVANALKAIESAKISVQNAENNLANALSSQTKNNQDLKANAITGFYDYLNILNSNLNKIDYILKVEGNSQLPGIGPVLAAKDGQTLIKARNDYWQAKKSYQNASSLALDSNSIENDYRILIIALEDMKTLVDDVILVLDSTVTSYDFPQTSLNAQKDVFTGYRSNMVANITGAKKTVQALENIEINSKRETDALNSALSSAKNQLKIAEISHQNSVSALNNAKQARAQQGLVNQSSVDSVQGQLNLIGTQVSDLTIKAPIAGKITKKYLEVGSEVQPGQKIAQIAQDDKLKIELSLNSSEVYRIKVGQQVRINNEVDGQINLIEPVADPITKKIRVEIGFDKEKAKLIIGSFVDVSIPLTSLRTTSENSVFVPLKAVSVTHNENYVFVVLEDRAVKTLVEIGEAQGNLIEIISGLKNGDKVVLEGSKLLEDGDQVIVK